MKKNLRGKLTYSNVISTLCLFLLIGGGTAFAASHLAKNSVGSKQLKKNAVTTAKIKNGAVTGAKIKLSSLGTVPSATNATNATNATTAANAEKLGGVAASSYAQNQLEAIHVIGASGQPAFESSCTNNGTPSVFGEAGFYKDGFGIVHLVGVLGTCTAGGNSAFTLPPGFRPAVDNLYGVAMTATTSGEVGILPDGRVTVFGGPAPRLFGLTFRAS